MAALRTLANQTTAGFLGMETKFLDTFHNYSAPSNQGDCTLGLIDPTGTVCLNAIGQGDGPTDRDGKKAVVKSVQVRGHVAVAPTILGSAPLAGQRVFVALIHDSGTNGAAMTSELCFTNPGGFAATLTSPLRNLLWNNRFRILKSQVFDVTPQNLTRNLAATAYSHTGIIRQFDWFVPLDMAVNFKDTTAVTANIVDNSLHLVAFQSGSDALLSYTARIRFVG